jgi:hypothetical protein
VGGVPVRRGPPDAEAAGVVRRAIGVVAGGLSVPLIWVDLHNPDGELAARVAVPDVCPEYVLLSRGLGLPPRLFAFRQGQYTEVAPPFVVPALEPRDAPPA